MITDGFVNRFQGGDNRIVGGWEAEPYSHPYIVSLQNKYLWRHRHTCAGSILNEYWVFYIVWFRTSGWKYCDPLRLFCLNFQILTAAHCVRENDSLLNIIIPMDIIAGIHSVKATDSSAQTIRVVERVIHPDYKG